MPAKSKSQRRLFGMGLSYKRGEMSQKTLKSLPKEIQEDVIELSHLSEKTLIKFSGTDQENLPYKVPKDKK